MLAGLFGFNVQGSDYLLQLRELQRLGLPLPRRVHSADALEHLAYHRRLRRVGKPLAGMPLRQGREPQFQGVDCQHPGMRHEVARHAVAGGRQEPSPTDFEMLDGRAVAAARVVASGGVEISVEVAHRRVFVLLKGWMADENAYDTG